MSGEIAGQEGNNHPTLSPMGVFHTSDGLVNLAASTDKMWKAFCDVMNADDLANNADYQSVTGRLQKREQLWQHVNGITSQHSTTYLVEKMNSVGIPCGPINSVGQAFEDEQVNSLNMTKSVKHLDLGDIDLLRSPINLSKFDHCCEFERPGPELGEHSAEILQELNYSEEKIAELEDKVARTFAEMENQRRRFEKEKDDAFDYGGFAFAKEALNLIDNLARSKLILESDESLKDTEALKKTLEHFDIINKDLISIFTKNNIKPIDCLNKKLDPNLHQAMMEIEDDQKEPGTIVQEVQKGFMIKDRLLRPSLVGVSKKTEIKDDKSEENKENLDK